MFGQIWIVFAALLIGELVLALNCEIARRRLGLVHDGTTADVAP